MCVGPNGAFLLSSAITIVAPLPILHRLLLLFDRLTPDILLACDFLLFILPFLQH